MPGILSPLVFGHGVHLGAVCETLQHLDAETDFAFDLAFDVYRHQSCSALNVLCLLRAQCSPKNQRADEYCEPDDDWRPALYSVQFLLAAQKHVTKKGARDNQEKNRGGDVPACQK